MKVEKPIFIVGVGRSGSSIFHRMFADHPRVAWLSVLCDHYPDKPGRNRALMKGVDAPAIGPLLKRKFGPAECYGFWNHHFRGFARPCRDLVAGDVTEAVRDRLSRTMPQLTTANAKPAASQDHRLAPTWLSARDLSGRKIHTYLSGWTGGGQFAAGGAVLVGMAGTAADGGTVSSANPSTRSGTDMDSPSSLWLQSSGKS